MYFGGQQVIKGRGKEERGDGDNRHTNLVPSWDGWLWGKPSQHSRNTQKTKNQQLQKQHKTHTPKKNKKKTKNPTKIGEKKDI